MVSKRQRRLARSGQTRNDHQPIARDLNIDILEVMLASAADDDFVLYHSMFTSDTRSIFFDHAKLQRDFGHLEFAQVAYDRIACMRTGLRQDYVF